MTDGTNVYWTDPTAGTISAVPVGGGTVVPIAQGQAKPARIALSGGVLYWTNTLGGAVMSAPANGTGPPAVFAAADQPSVIQVAGGAIYWIEQSLEAA